MSAFFLSDLRNCFGADVELGVALCEPLLAIPWLEPSDTL